MFGIRNSLAVCLFGSVLNATILFLACSTNVANGCDFAFPNVCENVTCPNGQNCSVHMDYWCPNKTGSICYPIAICGEYINPCAFTSCLTGTECTAVLDSCTNGICKVKASCNAISRPGACPHSPEVNSCANWCVTDALCEEGAKCCETPDLGKNCVEAIQNY